MHLQHVRHHYQPKFGKYCAMQTQKQSAALVMFNAAEKELLNVTLLLD